MHKYIALPKCRHAHAILAGRVLCLIAIVFVLDACAPRTQKQDDTMRVAATFYPLAYLTERIVGDKGTVFSIAPVAADFHSFHVTVNDIRALQTAHVLVVLGFAFAAVEEQLIDSLGQSITVINAAAALNPLPLHAPAYNEDGTALTHRELSDDTRQDKADTRATPFGNDPHVWLSPSNTKKMIHNISEGLIAADFKHAQYYNQNARALIADFADLDSTYRARFLNCEQEYILVNHNAFQYLADEYSFSIIALQGVVEASEPTIKEVALFVDIAKQYSIKYLFYSSQHDKRIADSVAADIGAQLIALHTLERMDTSGADYLALMSENLHNIATALACR